MCLEMRNIGFFLSLSLLIVVAGLPGCSKKEPINPVAKTKAEQTEKQTGENPYANQETDPADAAPPIAQPDNGLAEELAAQSPEPPPPGALPPSLPPPPNPAGYPHTVSRVIDGDTAVINISGVDERVRLIGIDTPETKREGSPVEYCGPESTKFTAALLDGKKVRLEYDAEKRDKYGRLLAYVYTTGKLSDGTAIEVFANAEIIASGYAGLMTIPPNVKRAGVFVENLRRARIEKRGLWGDNKCAPAR